MNAGFVSKKREEQLWEVQRIITQLKRKLKTFEKKQEKSQEELEASSTSLGSDVIDFVGKIPKNISNEDEPNILQAVTKENEQITTQDFVNEIKDEGNITTSSSCSTNLKQSDGLYIDEESGLLMVAKTHPDYATLLRLQLENQELIAWKTQLQARISSERAESLRLKQLHQQMINKMSHQKGGSNSQDVPPPPDGDYECIVEHFIRENALLEHKKQMLAKEIFEENKQCIAFQVELAMQKF